jgi:hypothetical protein
MSVQYRVAFGKNDEVVEGPDDAELVISIAAADASLAPEVAFMLGKLKNTGATGALFAVLSDGSAGEAIRRLAGSRA